MGFMDKLRSLFGKKPGKGKPPRTSILPKGEGGHRGIAAGDVSERARIQQTGQWPYTEEEMEQWKPVPADQVEAFLYHQELMPVHSTNVAAAQYFIEDQKMMIEFENGSAYLYSNITEPEALQFAQAASKGTWVWDHIRVRGNPRATRKSFVKIR